MAGKKIAFLSEQIPDIIRKKLENLGYGCVLLPKCDNLDTPVASHPDMLFSVFDGGALLCDEAYYQKNKALLDGSGASFVISRSRLGKKYPQDIIFDVININGTVYGKEPFIAPEILQNAEKVVNVSQGYALCSTLVTDKCAITADEGLYCTLTESGVNALKISPGGIALSGYSFGFIGGASVFVPESNTVIFFGNIKNHPNGDIICKFLKEHGHAVCDFPELPLTDYGGAKLITIKNA